MRITVEISTEVPEGGSGSEAHLLIRALKDYGIAAKKRFDEKSEAKEMTKDLWSIYQTDINTTLSAFSNRLLQAVEQHTDSTSENQRIATRNRQGEVVFRVSTALPENESYSELDALNKAVGYHTADRELIKRKFGESDEPAGSFISTLFDDCGTLNTLWDKLEEADSDDLTATTGGEISLVLSTYEPNGGGNSEFSIIHFAVNDAYKNVCIRIKGYKDSVQTPEPDTHAEELSEAKAFKSLVAKLNGLLGEMHSA